MSERFIDMAKKLEKEKGTVTRLDNIKSLYIDTLREMAEQSIIFGTIDTYIKFLFLKHRTKCDQVKNVLSFFFLYE